MSYRQLDPKPDFEKIESEILKFWENDQTFKKSIGSPAGQIPKGGFVFFEGPPTANGRPGIHHLEARAFKDIICRYKTMQGYQIRRKAGWDTQGLPVELEVEKKLGITGKPDIEKYGVTEFNQACKASVWEYKDIWEDFTRKIGFWLDLDNPYITYENDYIESVWWILKQASEKELLYKGHKVVPHCPRCGTSLSSHEVAQGYKTVEEPSVTVEFRLKPGQKINGKEINKNTYILAWTTTPWTLPGNVALAVGKNIDYVLVGGTETTNNFILAKDRLEAIFKNSPTNIIAEFKGNHLEGLDYEPLFDIKSIKESGKRAYFVATADFVTTQDGTGVVHTAVMYGEDDYSLGHDIGLPEVHTVDEAGLFTKDLARYDLAGAFVKDPKTDKRIISYLESHDLLFDQAVYEHDYPFCWRCDSALLYYAKDSWFIAMSQLRKELLKNNEQIHWVPDYIKNGRFGEWLRDVKDWAISRERYWGTPLPIWECECGERIIIGSRKELEDLQTIKVDLSKLDLHRPFIDDVKLRCKCGKEAQRVRAVLDCWFDSGAMPFAQHHYPFENKELIDSGEQFPAVYISEAIDQTRGWFYTLLAISTFLGFESPYKNCIVGGVVLDERGQKMSKSRGNAVDPFDMIKKYGADSCRWYFYTVNGCAEPKLFGESSLDQIVKKTIIILWNIVSFFSTYANIDKWSPDENFENSILKIKTEGHVLDQWLLARFEKLKKTVTENLEKYEVIQAARPINEFITDFSTWYIRRSRRRFWKSEDDQDKKNAYAATYFTLTGLLQLLAPFMPFISDYLYQGLGENNQSIHLKAWPKSDAINEKIISEMDRVKKIIEVGLAKRAEAKIKVRQPLNKIIINVKVHDEYKNLILDELNVKNIEVIENKEEGISLGLDTTVTPDLKAEGLVRELVRITQEARKEASYNIDDRINFYFETSDKEIIEAIEKFKDYLINEILAINIKAKRQTVDLEKNVEIDKKKIWIGIEK